MRQEAVQEEEDSSPPRLGVRFLPTIPSAADSSVVMEDGDSGLNPDLSGLYAALQNPQQPFTVKALVISENSPSSTAARTSNTNKINTSNPSSRNNLSSSTASAPPTPQTQTTPLSPPPPQLPPPEPQDKPP